MTQFHLRHLSLVASHPDADALWHQLRQEAEQASGSSPMLAPFFLDCILDQPDLESAAFYRIATRLMDEALPRPVLLQAFRRATAATPDIGAGLKADIAAVFERDPACERILDPLMYFKGFHALQAHRLSHWMWGQGCRDFALYLQSRMSEVFQTDFHPAAQLGFGLFLDHATGLVVGETAVIEDHVSLLQGITLGGTGKQSGDRHPKLRRGVMVGAGAQILGDIEVGEDARIAAGSVVLQPVPPRATVAGVPARTVRVDAPGMPQRSGDEILSELAYDGFDYTI